MMKRKLGAVVAALVVVWAAGLWFAWRWTKRPAATSVPASVSCSGESFAGEVVAVLDGDTVDVMRDGRAVRVRLHEVDAPEKAQDFGQRAKQFTSEQAHRKRVTVCIADTDRYGRSVGVVVLPDGRVLNREIVSAGLAWWYRRYSRDASMGALEQDARAAQRGLWAGSSPQPPWEWRAKRRGRQ